MNGLSEPHLNSVYHPKVHERSQPGAILPPAHFPPPPTGANGHGTEPNLDPPQNAAWGPVGGALHKGWVTCGKSHPLSEPQHGINMGDS